MSLSASCPRCGHPLPAQELLVGKSVRCPGCAKVLRVPSSGSSSGGPASGSGATVGGSGGTTAAPHAPIRAARPQSTPPAQSGSPPAQGGSPPVAGAASVPNYGSASGTTAASGDIRAVRPTQPVLRDVSSDSLSGLFDEELQSALPQAPTAKDVPAGQSPIAQTYAVQPVASGAETVAPDVPQQPAEAAIGGDDAAPFSTEQLAGIVITTGVFLIAVSALSVMITGIFTIVFALLLAFGVVSFLYGFVWGAAEAFSEGRPTGLLYLFFPPFVIIFARTRWRRMRKAVEWQVRGIGSILIAPVFMLLVLVIAPAIQQVLYGTAAATSQIEGRIAAPEFAASGIDGGSRQTVHIPRQKRVVHRDGGSEGSMDLADEFEGVGEPRAAHDDAPPSPAEITRFRATTKQKPASPRVREIAVEVDDRQASQPRPGELNVFLPAAISKAGSAPVLLVPVAGVNPFEPATTAERFPLALRAAQQGFVVVEFKALPGDAEDAADLAARLNRLQAEDGGLRQTRYAAHYARTQIAVADPARLFLAGSGYGASLALIYATQDSAVKGCAVCAPECDLVQTVKEFPTTTAGSVTQFDLERLAARYSPNNYVRELRCPILVDRGFAFDRSAEGPNERGAAESPRATPPSATQPPDGAKSQVRGDDVAVAHAKATDAAEKVESDLKAFVAAARTGGANVHFEERASGAWHDAPLAVDHLLYWLRFQAGGNPGAVEDLGRPIVNVSDNGSFPTAFAALAKWEAPAATPRMAPEVSPEGLRLPVDVRNVLSVRFASPAATSIALVRRTEAADAGGRASWSVEVDELPSLAKKFGSSHMGPVRVLDLDAAAKRLILLGDDALEIVDYGGDHTLAKWPLAANMAAAELSAAFLPGDRVLLADAGHRAMARRINDGSIAYVLEQPAVVPLPDRQRILGFDWHGGYVLPTLFAGDDAHSCGNLEPARIRSAAPQLSAAAFDARGSTFAAAFAGELLVWDLTDGRLIGRGDRAAPGPLQLLGGGWLLNYPKIFHVGKETTAFAVADAPPGVRLRPECVDDAPPGKVWLMAGVPYANESYLLPLELPLDDPAAVASSASAAGVPLPLPPKTIESLRGSLAAAQVAAQRGAGSRSARDANALSPPAGAGDEVDPLDVTPAHKGSPLLPDERMRPTRNRYLDLLALDDKDLAERLLWWQAAARPTPGLRWGVAVCNLLPLNGENEQLRATRLAACDVVAAAVTKGLRYRWQRGSFGAWNESQCPAAQGVIAFANGSPSAEKLMRDAADAGLEALALIVPKAAGAGAAPGDFGLQVMLVDSCEGRLLWTSETATIPEGTLNPLNTEPGRRLLSNLKDALDGPFQPGPLKAETTAEQAGAALADRAKLLEAARAPEVSLMLRLRLMLDARNAVARHWLPQEKAVEWCDAALGQQPADQEGNGRESRAKAFFAQPADARRAWLVAAFKLGEG